MDNSQLQRYSRHILLEEFGVEGQQKISDSTMLVVGAGGLGCAAALYLTAAGVGTIVVVDDDVVDLTNLQRQILHTTNRIDTPKVTSAAKTLTEINPLCTIKTVQEKFGEHNAAALVEMADVVLDCTDNYTARHLVNRICKQHNTPLVFAAAAGFDGQLAVFDFRHAASPCYHCLFDESDSADDKPCSLFGVFAPLVGTIGCMQSGEAIKLIAMPELAATNKLILADARNTTFREIKLKQDPQCKVCQSYPNKI